MDDCTKGCGRRQFIVLSAGVVAVAACGGSGMPGAVTAHDVAAGNVSDLPIGSARVTSDSDAVVMRDSGGVYAMSLICTHAGCNIADSGTVSASLLVCGCHGSRFSGDGAVLRGPAQSPLPHYGVSIDGSGNITVHVGSAVPAGTRVPA